MTDPAVLEVSVPVAARPEIVFSYFTDPARHAQWMGSHATLEPVPGGAYRVSPRDWVEAVGEFLEIDPPHRVVFTWGWTRGNTVAPRSTRVVVTLQEHDAGPESCCATTTCQPRSTSSSTAAAGSCTSAGCGPGSRTANPGPGPNA